MCYRALRTRDSILAEAGASTWEMLPAAADGANCRESSFAGHARTATRDA